MLMWAILLSFSLHFSNAAPGNEHPLKRDKRGGIERVCWVNGNKYQNNEVFQHHYFKKKCTIKQWTWYTQIIGCVWPKAPDTDIPLGKSHQVADQLATCRTNPKTGGASLHIGPAPPPVVEQKNEPVPPTNKPTTAAQKTESPVPTENPTEEILTSAPTEAPIAVKTTNAPKAEGASSPAPISTTTECENGTAKSPKKLMDVLLYSGRANDKGKKLTYAKKPRKQYTVYDNGNTTTTCGENGVACTPLPEEALKPAAIDCLTETDCSNEESEILRETENDEKPKSRPSLPEKDGNKPERPPVNNQPARPSDSQGGQADIKPHQPPPKGANSGPTGPEESQPNPKTPPTPKMPDMDKLFGAENARTPGNTNLRTTPMMMD